MCIAGVLVGHGHHDDGHFINLLCGQGAGLVMHTSRLHPAFEVGAKAGAHQVAPARGDGDLLGVGQIKRQMGGGGIALCRFGLQAAQHHLLQPLGQQGFDLARRHRVHPQALAQTSGSLRFTKR